MGFTRSLFICLLCRVAGVSIIREHVEGQVATKKQVDSASSTVTERMALRCPVFINYRSGQWELELSVSPGEDERSVGESFTDLVHDFATEHQWASRGAYIRLLNGPDIMRRNHEGWYEVNNQRWRPYVFERVKSGRPIEVEWPPAPRG